MADRTTDYALAVYNGDAVAGRLVRQACVRHLRDMAEQAEKGLEWRVDEAEAVIDFFSEVLCLPEESAAGETAPDEEEPIDGSAFVLQPWEQFIVGSLMGWYTVKGYRRFRTAYIETAKGSGKSPLCAGLLVYLLVADGQRGAQYFVAAVTREQGQIAFADCQKMVHASPYLREMIDQKVNNLSVEASGSFIRAISSEKRGLDGKRVSGAVLDELHEHPSGVVVSKIRKGTKGRPNALIMEPTNSGFDRTSVCWAHHEYSRKVLDGTIEGEDWFAFVCGLDPCDACAEQGKWFPDEECPNCDDWKTEGSHWLKPNPNLGVSLPWKYVRDLVKQAKGMPSEVSDVLRFNFCVWTQGVDRAIDMGRWAACQPMPSDDELIGADCFGCLDLGETDDFTAWGRLWVLDDGRVAVKMRYWVPQAALERYPNRPYAEWMRAKLLTVTPGDVTDYAAVRAKIIEDCQRDGVISVCFDTKTARETSQLLIAEGIDMIPMAQGFQLNEAIKRLLGLIIAGQLCHGSEPILSWMASNVVLITGQKGDKRLAKERSPEKIDGVAALVMGIEGALVRRERTPEPTYQVLFVGGVR